MADWNEASDETRPQVSSEHQDDGLKLDFGGAKEVDGLELDFSEGGDEYDADVRLYGI